MVDAEFHGVLHGDLNASISTDGDITSKDELSEGGDVNA
jgi:hypothetical protein